MPWYALGLAVPLAVGILAYGAAWLTGLVQFEGSAGALLVGLVSAATWIMISNFIFATGKEIGWRGYMLTRLIDAARKGANAALWTGEAGILTVVVLVVVAATVSRGTWTYIRGLPGQGVPLSRQLSASPRLRPKHP